MASPTSLFPLARNVRLLRWHFRHGVVLHDVHLMPIQRRIKPVAREEFFMPALLDNSALIDHENAIGITNGAQAMRDDERGAASHQAIERIEQHRFGSR